MKIVAWRVICTSIDEGGLGLKSIRTLAEAAIQRQTWFVASKRSPIWNDWAQVKYYKKGTVFGLSRCLPIVRRGGGESLAADLNP